MSPSERRQLAAALAVALLVRLLALWAAADAQLVKDETSYVGRAEALLDGEGYVGSYQSWVRHPGWKLAELPQYPGAYQPPGYPTFMAAAMAVSGRSLVAVKLAQCAVGVLGILALYGLGRAWFGHAPALLAAWGCALYPNLIAFSHLLWSETLFATLLLASLWLLLGAGGVPSARRAVVAGLALGAAALTRTTIIYFAPLLALWLVLATRARDRAPGAWRVAAARGALALACSLLAVAPWALRNAQLHGAFVGLDTNNAYNLWRGNTPDPYVQRGDPRSVSYAWPFDGVPMYPVGNLNATLLLHHLRRDTGVELPTDLQVVRYARAAALDQIRRDPAGFARRAVDKLVDMWNPTSFLLRHLQLGAYGAVPRGLEAAISVAAVGSYLALLPLAALGMALRWRDPNVWGLALLVAYFSAGSVLAFGLTRFRLPLMPLLMLPAAVALLWRAGRRG